MRTIVKNTRIAGICTGVPSQKYNLFENLDYPKEEMDRIYANTGISEIRVAPPGMIVSDMCIAAAERLFEKLGWDKSSIDVLVFVTQGPDFALPATACLIQDRLGLSTKCAAFDVNLGCSGYTYGLWMVSQFLSGIKGGRGLLLVGDRPTGGIDPDDRSTLVLFGDAGAATALEYTDDENPAYYVAGSDGSGGGHLNLKYGGCRYPTTMKLNPDPNAKYPLTLQIGHNDKPKYVDLTSRDEIRDMLRATKIYLDGSEVFGFTLRTIPPMLREALEFASVTTDQIDYFVFHQANKFILDHLIRKMKVPKEKAPIDLEKWGNTSSTSIPLTICDVLSKEVTTSRKKLCMAGFGVGWSWAANVIDLDHIGMAEVFDIPDDYPCGWKNI